MTAINILLNGETREIPKEIDLAGLLDHFSFPKQRVAVEVNKTVVRRADWPATVIRDRDKIEVVHFVGGG